MKVNLLIPDIFTIKTYWRFHGKQCDCLKYVAVKDVPYYAISIRIPLKKAVEINITEAISLSKHAKIC